MSDDTHMWGTIYLLMGCVMCPSNSLKGGVVGDNQFWTALSNAWATGLYDDVVSGEIAGTDLYMWVRSIGRRTPNPSKEGFLLGLSDVIGRKWPSDASKSKH